MRSQARSTTVYITGKVCVQMQSLREAGKKIDFSKKYKESLKIQAC